MFRFTEGPFEGEPFTNQDWRKARRTGFATYGAMLDSGEIKNAMTPDEFRDWQDSWKREPVVPDGDLTSVLAISGGNHILFARYQDGLCLSISEKDYPESIEDQAGMLEETRKNLGIATYNPDLYGGVYVVWRSGETLLHGGWNTQSADLPVKARDYIALNCTEYYPRQNLMVTSRFKKHVIFHRGTADRLYKRHAFSPIDLPSGGLFLWRAGGLWTAEQFTEEDLTEAGITPGDWVGFYETEQEAEDAAIKQLKKEQDVYDQVGCPLLGIEPKPKRRHPHQIDVSTVGGLKEALAGLPDSAEVVVEIEGVAHRARGIFCSSAEMGTLLQPVPGESACEPENARTIEITF